MDWRFAQLCALTVNLQLGKNRRPFTPEDFMPVHAAERRADRRRLVDAAATGVPQEPETAPVGAVPEPADALDARRARIAEQLEATLRGMMTRRKGG